MAEGRRGGFLIRLIGYRLRRASAAFVTDFNHALAEMGVRQVPFGVLAVIGETPWISQGDLCRQLGIQRANMVPIINDLSARGLVDRRTPASDRRSVEISLTPSGEGFLDRCIDLINKHEQGMLEGLSVEDIDRFGNILERLEATGRSRQDALWSREPVD